MERRPNPELAFMCGFYRIGDMSDTLTFDLTKWPDFHGVRRMLRSDTYLIWNALTIKIETSRFNNIFITKNRNTDSTTFRYIKRNKCTIEFIENVLIWNGFQNKCEYKKKWINPMMRLIKRNKKYSIFFINEPKEKYDLTRIFGHFDVCFPCCFILLRSHVAVPLETTPCWLKKIDAFCC